MKLIISSLVILATTLKCEGNLSLLGGILSTAHERVHDVAGHVLGTINKGLNFNFEGQFGVNDQRQPGYGYQHQGHNEYDSYSNYGQGSYGYRPNQNGVQQPVSNSQRPYIPNNNGYNRPAYNGNNNFNEQYGNGPPRYPNNNYQNYPNNNNYGYNNQQRPNYQNYGNENGYSGNQNQGYNDNQNQGYPINPNYQINNGYNNQNIGDDNENNGYDSENNVYDNQNNGYNDNNNGYNDNNNGYNNNNNGYNDQNNVNKPIFEKPVNNEHGTPQGQKYPDPTTTSRPRLTPPTTIPTIPTTNANDEKEEANSQNSNEDAPLFIPLGQNEYIYGGDKINITAPKRETDNKPQKAEEEDFPIDIRFGDK